MTALNRSVDPSRYQASKGSKFTNNLARAHDRIEQTALSPSSNPRPGTAGMTRSKSQNRHVLAAYGQCYPEGDQAE